MTDPVVTPVPDPVESVPEPVRAAAWTWGTLATAITTAIGVAAAVGFLSVEQADLLNQVVGLVSTAIVPVGSIIVLVTGLVSGLAGAHATAAVARRKVTPVVKAPAYRHGEHL